MADLESILKIAGFVTAGLAAINYLCIRSSLLFQKNGNIVNGSYAKILSGKHSDFYHSFYLLGERSESIARYIENNPPLWR